MGPNVIQSTTTLSAAATARSTLLDASQATAGCVAVTVSGISGSVTFSVQRTLDGTNYDEFPNTTNYPSGQTKTLSTNTTWISETLDLAGVLAVAVNVSSAAGAGSLAITFLGKSDLYPSE